MKDTYSIKEAQSSLPALIRRAESGGLTTITRHGRAVAYVMGADDLAAMIETMDILANPAAMTAIADAEANKGPTFWLEDIAE